MTARILVVDNHDSFVFNLVQYLRELGADCDVRDRDDVRTEDGRKVDGVLISPGPGHPEDSGVCLDLILDTLAIRDSPTTRGARPVVRPLLGVCLGHQAIATAFGGIVDHAPAVVHGEAHEIHHTGQGVFAGLPTPFQATRYHSLAVRPDALPPELEVTARTADGVIMGLRHRDAPIEGVQFHPESILSEHGHRLLATWLAAIS